MSRDDLSETLTGRGRRSAPLGWWLPAYVLPWLLVGSLAGLAAEASANEGPSQHDRSLSYHHDVVPEVPWSIHVVKVERSHRELALCTTLGKGEVIGMGTVSEQLKTLAPELGRPLAAINGDFYENNDRYKGRPRDVQIRQGEVVSSPAGHTSFWIAPDGTPHMTNVFSRFRVVWADGTTTPIGLNEERKDDAAVLYTSVVGPSTRTSDGLELILEGATTNIWPPLRIGQTYGARVRAVRESGDAPLDRQTLVLSIGPQLAARLKRAEAGATLRVITETMPDLAGVEAAIGGGPMLVRNGQALRWNGLIQLRHPRTAVGWNKDHVFLVEVDGRQGDLSVGMTLPELAEYMVKVGCAEAMNLDGGGSATLWVLGSVRNSPSEGRERPAANALVVVRKQAPQN